MGSKQTMNSLKISGETLGSRVRYPNSSVRGTFNL